MPSISGGMSNYRGTSGIGGASSDGGDRREGMSGFSSDMCSVRNTSAIKGDSSDSTACNDQRGSMFGNTLGMIDGRDTRGIEITGLMAVT